MTLGRNMVIQLESKTECHLGELHFLMMMQLFIIKTTAVANAVHGAVKG